MKTKITILLLLVLGLSTAGLSQIDNGERVRLQNAIERTDELIGQAGEVVRESGSERALNQLEMAVKLQSMARQLTFQIDGNPMNWSDLMNQAGRYTMSARDKAQRAIAITRQAAENEEYVQKRLEKTDELIRRMEERIGRNAPESLRLLLDTSRDKQQRATEFYRDRRLKASLQLTLQVEKSLNEAADKAGGYEKAQNQYQMQSQRYFTLRERIELGRPADYPEAERELKNAERLRAQAEDLAANEGRYSQAAEVMQQAVEILNRVAEDLREPSKVRAAIEDMNKTAERIGEMVGKFGDRDIRRQYQAAREHLVKATALYEREDYEGAAAQVQAARQIIIRISEVVERPMLIEHGLEIIRNQVTRMEERVAASGNPVVQKEFAEAGEILARASAFYKAGDYRAAAAQLEIAERMLARIDHTLGE